MLVREVTAGRIFIGRLERGDDLLESLTAICRDKGVRLGRIEALGAVESAKVGYYDQRSREYRFFDLTGELELLSFIGNVSRHKGEPMIHAHTVFGDASGASWGGHLVAGTRVFACEYVIQELTGATLERGLDEQTGLPLWDKQ